MFMKFVGMEEQNCTQFHHSLVRIKDSYVISYQLNCSQSNKSACFIAGGCAAQEVIKFITHQYKPVNNTFIYDAMTSNTVTYTF